LPTTKADRAITDIRLVSETKRGKNWMLIGFGAAAVVALTAGGMFLYRAGHAKGAASATAQPAVTAPSASVGPLTPTTNAQPIAPAPQPNGGSNAQSKPGSPAPANSALQTNTKPPAKDAAVNQPLKPTPANVSAANSGKPKLPSNLTSAIVPVPRRSASNSDPIAAPSIGNGAPNMAAMGGIVPGTNLGSPSQSQLQAPLPVGGHVQAPRLVSSTSPSYPALARRSRVEGDVVVDTTIDATGKVTGMKIISGPAMLQDAARDALRQWRYSPGTLNGQAIPTQMQVTIKFRLN
jgi:protein TonB